MPSSCSRALIIDLRQDSLCTFRFLRLTTRCCGLHYAVVPGSVLGIQEASCAQSSQVYRTCLCASSPKTCCHPTRHREACIRYSRAPAEAPCVYTCVCVRGCVCVLALLAPKHKANYHRTRISNYAKTVGASSHGAMPHTHAGSCIMQPHAASSPDAVVHSFN